jgi:hypothetical protein
MDSTPSNQDPFFGNIALKRPEEILVEDRKTVSLHLLVKNGASCVERLIDNVGPYIREVVAVINDTTDETFEILQKKCDYYDLLFNTIEITAKSHPSLYLLDVPETYMVGSSLHGEIYEGPFTGRPLLADWAGARNLGWVHTFSEWRLFLDADDEVVDPESIPGLCLALEERGVDLAATRYCFRQTKDGHVHSDGFRERLASHTPAIRWEGVAHEILRGASRTAHVDGSLQVVDRRDSSGSDLRPAGRCFKVLYREARLKNWQVSPRNLIYMAMECQKETPALAEAVIDLYLTKSTWKEERAWAYVMRGEICAERKDFGGASKWFEHSLAEHPGAKAAFRLCYSRFQEGKWREAIDAYRQGIKNKAILQVLESGEVFEHMSKILVAAAYRKLGDHDNALKFCDEALVAFPENTTLHTLKTELLKAAKRRSP